MASKHTQSRYDDVRWCIIDQYGRWLACFDVPAWVAQKAHTVRVMWEGRESNDDIVFVKANQLNVWPWEV